MDRLSSPAVEFSIVFLQDLFVVKRQRRMVDTAIFLGPLVLTLAVALLPPSNLQTFQSLVFLGVEGLQGGRGGGGIP